MKKIVIYSGRFQPMLKHHAEVYRKLQAEFPDADVYVATSDKVEAPKSPFNFQEKQSIITAHNIPRDHIIKVANPYKWEEYAQKFDAYNTILIFAVGQKDSERFKFNLDREIGLNLKKDGTPSHAQPLSALQENPLPMQERSYIYLIPTLVDSDREAQSASKFREEIKNAPNLAAAKRLYTKQFGGYNEHVFMLIYKKLKGNDAMTEHLNHLRRLAGVQEAAPVPFGGAVNASSVKFVPGSDSASKMSIANRFPADADINDAAQKKEVFLKALTTSPAALLAEINGRLDPKDDNSLEAGERLNGIIADLESGGNRVTDLDPEDRKFVIGIVASAVKNMELSAGDTSAPEAEPEEELKDSFDLDELRVRAGISPVGEADESSDTGYGPEVLDHPDIAGMIDDAMDGGYHDGAKYKRAVIKVSQELGMSPREVDQQYRAISPYSPYVPEVSFDKSMSESEHEDDDDDYDGTSGKFRDEWGRDTEEQDQWKKNVTGKKNKNEVDERAQRVKVFQKQGMAEGLFDGVAGAFRDAGAKKFKKLLDGGTPASQIATHISTMPAKKRQDIKSAISHHLKSNDHAGLKKLHDMIGEEVEQMAEAAEGSDDQKLGTLAREIEMQVGAHFPDSEGLDAIMSRARKIYGFDRNYPEDMLMDLINDAVKKHLGSNDFYSYVEDFHAQHASDNPEDEDMYEQGMTEGADPGKFNKIMNMLSQFDRKATEMGAYGDLNKRAVAQALLSGEDVESVIDTFLDEYHDQEGEGAYDASQEFQMLLIDLRDDLEHVLSQGMSESQEDDDESVYYDDEDEGDDGIDWDEEEEVDESLTFNKEKLPMVKLADIMADYGLTEASKPDFLDMDKDGDKKEPMKKAVKDAEKKSHDKEKKTDESIEENITSTSENAVQQALAELRKLAGL